MVTAQICVELDVIRFKDEVNEWLLGLIVGDEEGVRGA